MDWRWGKYLGSSAGFHLATAAGGKFTQPHSFVTGHLQTAQPSQPSVMRAGALPLLVLVALGVYRATLFLLVGL